MPAKPQKNSVKGRFDGWLNRYFGDSEAILLTLMLAGGLVIILTMGKVVAPVLAALIFAFLLQSPVERLQKWRVPPLASVITVFVLFVSLLLAALIFMAPLVVRQASNLLSEVPRMLSQLHTALMTLPEKYPQLISEEQLTSLMGQLSGQLAVGAENMLAGLFNTVPNLVAVIVYLVVVPFMVFFMLKDRESLLQSLSGMLPEHRPVMSRIWAEMNDQMANYVRGKAVEIVIVGVATYIVFLVLGVNYAALLGLLVGFSVVIPYIGAALVTIPVAMVGYFQWGWGGEFMWLMLAYGVIQFLDGNVLVPLLFSEAVNLHPVAIILAVLVFGGFWGVWGVFFAIPLATLVKALYNAWPRTEVTSSG
ncbi:AI-2E family transporter [Porticoccus sp. W117]|uniref:AI-2E family transporter n=1 Tax=Porticoccus sp. W117 TaxID=3054777 RepID=UPI002598AA4A|nr:AI-2E family transporter [Porticoccus sp. W117]MDM3871430.1 AI-2E family transporter [Porticoccus sp. W117]